MSTVTALSLLSMDPSPAVTHAASAAAGTRHGLINLTRLVRSLDKQGSKRAKEERDGSSWLEVQKDWEMVLYARALLFAMRNAVAQSSSTASSLNDLERKLSDAETHIQATAKQTRAPAPTTALPLLDLPASVTKVTITSPVALLDEDVPATLTLDTGEASLPADLDVPVSHPKMRSPSLSPAVSPALPRSGANFNTTSYFSKRAREDSQGGEAGLLPLKIQKQSKDPMDQEGMRQRLMGGAGAIGASQLHEELGGQLADMSHQLKLNAIHFSNSLEEEKALLQSSQDVLEKNLESTKVSKTHLSHVSTKSRGTTCMTLGIVILVLVLFVWTYLLIRFT